MPECTSYCLGEKILCSRMLEEGCDSQLCSYLREKILNLKYKRLYAYLNYREPKSLNSKLKLE